jgi:capsular exopolysaccharide synthesis family protein
MNDIVPTKDSAPLPADPAYAGYAAFGPVPAPAYGAPVSQNRARRYLAFLRRLWWVPALTLLVTLGAATAYVLMAPPTYSSTAALWETEKFHLPEGAAFTDDLQTHLGTQIGLLSTSRIRQLALARLQASGTNTIPLDKEGKPLNVKLTITQAPNKGSILLAVASSPNAAYSQAFLDALMNEFLLYKKTVRKLVSGDTLASISEQVLRLERDLRADQEALTTFQRTNNLAILQEEGAVAGGYLTKLKTELSDLQLESQLLEATALEQAAGASAKTNSGGFLMDAMRRSDSGSSSPAGAERQLAYKELQLLQMERDRLSKYFRPKHPEMVRLDRDLENSRKLVELYRNESREQLDASRQAAKMKTASVQASIKEWEGKVVAANALIAEAERLKLNVNRTQSLYDRLQTLLQNVDISRNIDQETSAILEPAAPAVRSYQRELTVLGMALFAGLALGLGIVFLVEKRDDRLLSVLEVSEKLTDSVVGQVPELPSGLRNGPLPLLEHDDDRHTYVESYRNLRSALLFLPVEGQRPKIILITSALPGEGKSTVAANLARTLAQGGSRVLLVDADLRKGRLHETMGLVQGPGLAELLKEPADLDKLLQRNSWPNLAFLSCGNCSENPGDLFLGPQLDPLLALWRQQFDHVLIDTCPVFAADDATTLAPKVDGTLLVVRSRFSGARVVREALDLLYQRQARLLGLIFNRADASAKSYYFYKCSGYAGKKKEPKKA